MVDLLAILITWRLSYLVTTEDAPFDLAVKFRHVLGVRYNEHNQRIAKGQLAKLVTCMFCTSMWVGWLVAAVVYRDPIAFWFGLAYSGGAMIVQRLVSR